MCRTCDVEPKPNSLVRSLSRVVTLARRTIKGHTVEHACPALPHATPIGSHRELPAPAFFRIRDVLRITGLSRPTLYRRIAACRFPPPVHLGGRACGWPCAALQAWIADPESYRAPQAAHASPPRKRGRPCKYAA